MAATLGTTKPGCFCLTCDQTRTVRCPDLYAFPHHMAVVDFFIILSNQGGVIPCSTHHALKYPGLLLSIGKEIPCSAAQVIILQPCTPTQGWTGFMNSDEAAA